MSPIGHGCDLQRPTKSYQNSPSMSTDWTTNLRSIFLCLRLVRISGDVEIHLALSISLTLPTKVCPT